MVCAHTYKVISNKEVPREKKNGRGYVSIQGITVADYVAIRAVLLHAQQPKLLRHSVQEVDVIRGGVAGVAAQVKAACI